MSRVTSTTSSSRAWAPSPWARCPSPSASSSPTHLEQCPICAEDAASLRARRDPADRRRPRRRALPGAARPDHGRRRARGRSCCAPPPRPRARCASPRRAPRRVARRSSLRVAAGAAALLILGGVDRRHGPRRRRAARTRARSPPRSAAATPGSRSPATARTSSSTASPRRRATRSTSCGSRAATPRRVPPSDDLSRAVFVVGSGRRRDPRAPAGGRSRDGHRRSAPGARGSPRRRPSSSPRGSDLGPGEVAIHPFPGGADRDALGVAEQEALGASVQPEARAAARPARSSRRPRRRRRSPSPWAIDSTARTIVWSWPARSMPAMNERSILTASTRKRRRWLSDE